MNDRVVFVTPEIDPHPTSGGAIRTLHLVRELARRAAVDLHVVDHAVDAAELRAATGAASVTVHRRHGGRLRVRARGWLHGWPLNASRRWHPACAAAVQAAAAAGIPVVLEHVYLAVLAPSTGRYVLALQNAETAVFAELPVPGGVRGIEHRLDVALVRRFERRAVRHEGADVVAVSAHDAAMLGIDCAVVANGTDVPATTTLRPATGRVTYVGSMTWPPNRYAVEWWRDEVHPHLPADIPPLTVVGRGSSEAFGSDARLDVLGAVADVVPVLEESRVVVVPLHHGSGTRLKILEAFAYRRPVVTTTKGAEGLPVRDDVEALVADTPAAFAAAVTRLWREDDVAARLVAAGAQVADDHRWDRLAHAFADIVLGVA